MSQVVSLPTDHVVTFYGPEQFGVGGSAVLKHEDRTTYLYWGITLRGRTDYTLQDPAVKYKVYPHLLAACKAYIEVHYLPGTTLCRLNWGRRLRRPSEHRHVHAH